MKKRTAIILISIVVIIALVAGALYLWYSKESEEPEKPGENYETEYQDDKDITEVITPVAIAVNQKQVMISFSQKKESELPSNKIKEIQNVMNGTPGHTVKAKELSTMLGANAETFFSDYSKLFIHKRNVGNTSSGYDFKVTRQSDLYEQLFFLITTADLDEFYHRTYPSEDNSITIGDTKVSISYSHNQRTIVKTGKTVNQYTFDIILRQGRTAMFLQMHFSGFDGELKGLNITGQEASGRVAELIEKLLLRKK